MCQCDKKAKKKSSSACFKEAKKTIKRGKKLAVSTNNAFSEFWLTKIRNDRRIANEKAFSKREKESAKRELKAIKAKRSEAEIKQAQQKAALALSFVFMAFLVAITFGAVPKLVSLLQKAGNALTKVIEKNA